MLTERKANAIDLDNKINNYDAFVIKPSEIDEYFNLYVRIKSFHPKDDTTYYVYAAYSKAGYQYTVTVPNDITFKEYFEETDTYSIYNVNKDTIHYDISFCLSN